MNNPSFWNNKDNSEVLIKELSNLKNIITPIEECQKEIKDNIDIVNLLLQEEDEDLYNIVLESYQKIESNVEHLKLMTYLNGQYDKENCLLEIHAGAGGTESCDWANMLYRMYTRYLHKEGYEVTELDSQPGEEVGIKSVLISIKGPYAYGYLKHEKGVHRLVRISPFDANKRRHTSFASVEVIPEISQNIDIEINDKDLRIDVYRSSGAGGQSVNTTDSAVRVTHIPTGIVVTCQNERSQIQNKEKAIEILKSKLYNLEIEKQNQELNKLTEGQKSISFGSGKRSYVMCPYTLVKDNESGYETSDVNKILDGGLDELIIKGIRRG